MRSTEYHFAHSQIGKHLLVFFAAYLGSVLKPIPTSGWAKCTATAWTI
ncbi:MAG: hypothetical protein ACI9C4_000505, partial [Paraglaciecola sp.]